MRSMTAPESLAFLASARRAASALLRSAAPESERSTRTCDFSDSPVLQGLIDALAAPASSEPAGIPGLDDLHRALRSRLELHGETLPRTVRPLDGAPPYLRQFDEGFQTVLGPGILRGVHVRDGEEVSLTGLVGGAGMSPVAAWMLAESVLTSVKARPERPIVFVLDAACVVAGMDESLPLSEYLAHLARAIAWARSQAVAVNTWIAGRTDAASLVACTALVARTVAFPGAVAGVDLEASPGWVTSGLVDECTSGDRRVPLAWNISA